MIYLMKLKNGTEFEISQGARDQITGMLIGPKETRPDFIEVKTACVVVAVSSIAAIIPYRHEPERLPTPEEDLKEFNERWNREHPKNTGMQ